MGPYQKQCYQREEGDGVAIEPGADEDRAIGFHKAKNDACNQGAAYAAEAVSTMMASAL